MKTDTSTPTETDVHAGMAALRDDGWFHGNILDPAWRVFFRNSRGHPMTCVTDVLSTIASFFPRRANHPDFWWRGQWLVFRVRKFAKRYGYVPKSVSDAVTFLVKVGIIRRKYLRGSIGKYVLITLDLDALKAVSTDPKDALEDSENESPARSPQDYTPHGPGCPQDYTQGAHGTTGKGATGLQVRGPQDYREGAHGTTSETPFESPSESPKEKNLTTTPAAAPPKPEVVVVASTSSQRGAIAPLHPPVAPTQKLKSKSGTKTTTPEPTTGSVVLNAGGKLFQEAFLYMQATAPGVIKAPLDQEALEAINRFAFNPEEASYLARIYFRACLSAGNPPILKPRYDFIPANESMKRLPYFFANQEKVLKGLANPIVRGKHSWRGLEKFEEGVYEEDGFAGLDEAWADPVSDLQSILEDGRKGTEVAAQRKSANLEARARRRQPPAAEEPALLLVPEIRNRRAEEEQLWEEQGIGTVLHRDTDDPPQGG